MRDHVKILGILNIVVGCLGLLAALAIFTLFGGLAGAAGMAAGRDSDAMVDAGVLAGIGAFVSILIALLSIPQILGGWGLTKFKPWARVLMIVVSILNLFHIPIGTALGVYGMWVLLSDETRHLFETGGALTYGHPGPHPGPVGYAPQAPPYPSTVAYPPPSSTPPTYPPQPGYPPEPPRNS